VPATINPGGVDLKDWRELGADPVFASKQKEIVDLLSGMGFEPALSCAPITAATCRPGRRHCVAESSRRLCELRARRQDPAEGGPSALGRRDHRQDRAAGRCFRSTGVPRWWSRSAPSSATRQTWARSASSPERRRARAFLVQGRAAPRREGGRVLAGPGRGHGCCGSGRRVPLGRSDSGGERGTRARAGAPAPFASTASPPVEPSRVLLFWDSGPGGLRLPSRVAGGDPRNRRRAAGQDDPHEALGDDLEGDGGEGGSRGPGRDDQARGGRIVCDTCIVVAPLRDLGVSSAAVDSAKAAIYLPAHQGVRTFSDRASSGLQAAETGDFEPRPRS